MKKIAQVIGYGIIGNGAFRAILNYCKHVEMGKFEFHFIFWKNSLYTFEKEIAELGGKTIKADIIELPSIFKSEKYDIVHSHINTLNCFVMFFAWLAGIKVRISHSHSTWGKCELLKNLVKCSLKPFSGIFTTHLFACSEYAGRWLFGSAKFTVFRNAIDLQKFTFNQNIRNEVRQKLGINEDTFVIGHIGRFEAQKNHKFLIKVFNEVQKIKQNSVLLLIGEGSLKGKIEKIANDGVKFLGTSNEVQRLYNAMDAFVLPSLYEGLPVVGIEAQANGLPCYFSDTITKEAEVTDLAEFLPLNVLEWVSCLSADLGYFKIDRLKYAGLVGDSGYDIVKEAKKLDELHGEIYK